MNTPQENQPPQRHPPLKASSQHVEDHGSLVLGVAIAWICLFLGYVASAAIGYALFMSNLLGDFGSAILIALPWLVMAGFAIGYLVKNQPRTSMGIVLGVASMLGVGLLLMAACNGLMGEGWS